MKKENIKKNIATIALVATLVAGGAGVIVEDNINHVIEYCPFCNILGMQHQVEVINHSGKYNGYTAIYVPKETKVDIHETSAIKHTNANGEIIYTAPSGYILEGTKATKETLVNEKEYIKIIDNRSFDGPTIHRIYKRK